MNQGMDKELLDRIIGYGFLPNVGSVVVRSSQGHLFFKTTGSLVVHSSQERFFVVVYVSWLNKCHI